MDGRLKNRVAVVTGGGSGIGLAAVRRLTNEGAVVVAGDINSDVRSVVAEAGGVYRRVDVTDADSVAGLYDFAHREFGTVDVAFNNAGIAPRTDGSILRTDLETWHQVQAVNLTSVFLCCKAVLPYMIAQHRGSIINTSSLAAVMGTITSQISYAASKGGILSLSRELGVAYAREGVRVNAICPGVVETPLVRELFSKDPREVNRRLVHIPAGRFARPEEISSVVAFLASDDSSYVTASSLMVDGGTSAAYVVL